ncbi:MAG: biotin transporter BioY [Treponema sp.]|nr:biotin transporter BioY [Treponema sp.]
MKDTKSLKYVFTALLAAIICAGCFIKIPLGFVPIVLQNVLCILTGVLLGGLSGWAPTALFIAAGAIGLPVFAGGTSGLAVLMGPTGGFYPGYLLGAFIAGIISGKPSVSEKNADIKLCARIALAIFAGMVILYIPGLIRFAAWAAGNGKVPQDKTVFGYTMAACVIPYLPGDLLKIIVSVPVAVKIRPVVAQYLYSSTRNENSTGENE